MDAPLAVDEIKSAFKELELAMRIALEEAASQAGSVRAAKPRQTDAASRVLWEALRNSQPG